MKTIGHTNDRRRVLLGLAAVLGATAWTPVTAATGLGEERVTGLRGTATGKVTAIDVPTRRLTAVGKRGELTFLVDSKVEGLEKYKVGDAVTVDYVAAVGLTVRRPKSASAPLPPVKTQGKRVKGVLRVLALDAANKTVKLQGPKGEVADLRVLDKQDIDGVKVGDRVEVVIYELVAAKVAPGGR
ncbi:MAG TPA: hypothetical protein VK996_02340 [Ramlibacter sp.]|nr:hypothetical protein [Ramlibacter sp.]